MKSSKMRSSDLMVNAHKFEELFHNITEDGESIDGNVDTMNELLIDIFEKYTKVESVFIL
jgi:hypothetical protein